MKTPVMEAVPYMGNDSESQNKSLAHTPKGHHTMARKVAFAMQLPLLSEEQEKMARRYGCEQCEEMRIVERGSGAVVAGVLRVPFKTKRAAQSAFCQNLKAWKITHPKYLRDWYRELSFEEYNAEFEGVPRVLGRWLQAVVSSTVARLLQIG